jgi:RHS repeat-associated protein
MLVPGRYGTSITNGHRYGFQGQEQDNELKGEGNSLNYTYRMHDPRIGRFFTTDPLEAKYPWYTPYQFSGNKPIQFIELEGLEEAYTPKPGEGTRSGFMETETPEGQLTGIPSVTELEEVVIVQGIIRNPTATGSSKEKPNGFYHSFFESYSEPDGTNGAYGLEAGYRYDSEYFSTDSRVRVLNAEFNNYTGQGELPLAVLVETRVAGIDFKTSNRMGTENFNYYVEGRACAFCAEAELSTGILTGEKDRYGFSLGGKAGASVLKGELSHGTTFFGIKFGTTIKGCVECAEVASILNFYYDNKKGKAVIEAKGALGLILGIGVDAIIEVPFK